MKKRLLIFVIFLSVGAFLSNAPAQENARATRSTVIPRKPTVSDQAIDVRARYAAIINRKRDGRFLLYSDPDGTKVFLTVKGGQPGPYLAFDSGGQNLPIVSQNGYGVCYICFGGRRGHPTRCIRIECPIR